MAFFQKIIAFFMAVIAFFTGLFSGGKKPEQPTPEPSNPTAYTYYDYAYGSAARQTLDLVLPPNGSGVVISEEDYRNHTGRYDQWMEALCTYSPLSFVNAQTVPTVLGHGKKDTVVPFANAEALDTALTSHGITHAFVVFPNSGHALDKDADASQRMNDLLLQYAQTYLK